MAAEALLPKNEFQSVVILKCFKDSTQHFLITSNSGDSEYPIWDSSRKGLALAASDALIACIVVAPSVVGVWRGVWGLMELHPMYFPYLQSYVFGITVHIAFALLRTWLRGRCLGAWGGLGGSGGRWARERLLCRLYTLLFILANVTHWRGGWAILDLAVGQLAHAAHLHQGYVYMAAVAGMTGALLFLRAARNLLASPYFLVTDGKEPTYIFTTRFNTQWDGSGKETGLFVLDCVFSVGVVGSLVVFVWRGSWALLDLYLHPDHPVYSHWTSFVIGYLLVGVTFLLQPGARWCCARLRGAPRLLLADLFHLLSFLATVNVWRGIWGLLDDYFLPDHPKLSNWITQVGCLVLLMLLNCSNSVLVRGVYIDAEEPAGECVVFPCHYLRLFFYRERTKKRHRRALLAAAAASASKRTDELSTAPLAPLSPILIQNKV